MAAMRVTRGPVEYVDEDILLIGIRHRVVRYASELHFGIGFRSKNFRNARKTLRFSNRICK